MHTVYMYIAVYNISKYHIHSIYYIYYIHIDQLTNQLHQPRIRIELTLVRRSRACPLVFPGTSYDGVSYMALFVVYRVT